MKEYRAHNNLSMDEFAKRCGLSKSYISMLEKGKHPQNERNLIPQIDTLAKIAKGMNTDLSTMSSVLDWNTLVTINIGSNDSEPEELTILKDRWEEISPDDKAIIKFISYKYK